MVTKKMNEQTQAKGVSFADISKWLGERGERSIKLTEEARLGTKSFMLHAVTLPFIERASLESRFGNPHEILNEYLVYRALDPQGEIIEATYIKYVRTMDSTTPWIF